MPRVNKNNIAELLTARQYEILRLLTKWISYNDIAEQLDITPGTVKQHVHRIYARMGTSNRMETVHKFRKYQSTKTKSKIK